jgi:hypothetical protein
MLGGALLSAQSMFVLSSHEEVLPHNSPKTCFQLILMVNLDQDGS